MKYRVFQKIKKIFEKEDHSKPSLIFEQLEEKTSKNF
jgi:hypothetical protein